MKCTTSSLTKWATALLAVGIAIAWSPASRAEDQPSSTVAAQPAATTAQPAAAAQPTSDQRLEELEKEVALLQEEIAALKSDSAAEMKTAAYAIPGTPAPAAGFSPGPAAEDAPPKISISSLLGPVTLSGFGDVYYGYDNNHPFNNLSGLRSFEGPTNGFNFNLAELILDKPADATSAESRLGYHVSAGYGFAAKLINGSDSPEVGGNGFADGSNFFLKEAYLTYLFPVGKGLTLEVGKFVTPMGAEVIESNANWNYSRGLLFDYSIPLFHFGANVKYAFNSKWAITGYLVNGWNNTLINHADVFDGITGQSSGLTYGASLVYTPSAKLTVTENYFAGPVADGVGVNNNTLTEWKQISDTVVAYTPNAKWAFQINGDYGFGPVVYSAEEDCEGDARATGGPHPEGFETFNCPSPAINWWGVAGYAKYTWTPKTNFAARYEYYDDSDGFTGLLNNTFFGQLGRGWAQEVTGTYSYNLTSALLIRGEYRYDFASKPIFFQSLSNFKSVKEQNTATISFVYSFSSANLK
jgi:putative OmpL-like beta-barrel porin-2